MATMLKKDEPKAAPKEAAPETAGPTINDALFTMPEENVPMDEGLKGLMRRFNEVQRFQDEVFGQLSRVPAKGSEHAAALAELKERMAEIAPAVRAVIAHHANAEAAKPKR